jgi:cbb3-type cytochrome oxidase subunit 3
MAMVFRVGLPLLILLVALAWFAFSSYRRAQIAEQAVAELKDQVRVLEKAVAAAEQGLRTLAANPSVPRDVALSADMTLNDIRRITDRKELDT